MQRKPRPIPVRSPQIQPSAPPIIAPIQMPSSKPRGKPILPPPPPPGVRSIDVGPPSSLPDGVRVMVTSLRQNPTIVAEDPDEQPLSAAPITLPGEAIEPIVTDEVSRPSLREAGKCELPVDELADPLTPPSSPPSLNPSPARQPLAPRSVPSRAPIPDDEDPTPIESHLPPVVSKPSGQGIVPARPRNRLRRQTSRRPPPRPWWKMTLKECLIFLLMIAVLGAAMFYLLFFYSPTF